VKVKTRTAKRSAGDAPRWKLGYLEVAEKEARKLLTPDQYAHAVQLFDELAFESRPTQSQTQDVRKIEDFYELRDKGGILGNINLRIYFTVFKEQRLILVLRTYKKEDDGQAPKHVKIRVRHRLRIAKDLMV